MKSLWLENQSLDYCSDLPIPSPQPGEALIHVSLAGICTTDLELVRGYYPFKGVPGHEFVGKVLASPGGSTWLSKRVVGEINIACGECETCLTGLPRHCERRKTLGIHDWNGAFAEYLVLPVRNLHLVPEHVIDEQAVFTEPLAAAHEILEQVQISESDRVLVIGAGRLGMLIARVLQINGCKVSVVVRHTRQRELLEGWNIPTLIEKDLGGRKYDLAVEATGSPIGFEMAHHVIHPRGTIILKSTYRGSLSVDFSQIVVDEVRLVGSRCGSFEPAIKLLAEGMVDPSPLIDACYPIEQGKAAFEQAGRQGVLKVLIKP